MSTSREKLNGAGNSDHSKFMAVHLSLMEEFFQFCKSKICIYFLLLAQFMFCSIL